MIEIRIHGRGGQGGVTLAELIIRAFCLGKKDNDVRAFPLFWVGRRGEPVTAFVRLSFGKKIFRRDQIYGPDYVIILDTRLIESQKVTEGLKKGGTILINTDKPDEFKNLGPFRIITIDATRIALEYGLGDKTDPKFNTAILGAIAKIIGIELDSVMTAIESKDSPIPKKYILQNIEAAKEGWKETRV